MNVKNIVIDWLKTHDYDGLFSDGDCGCEIDDLMPCDDCVDCMPGYKVICPKDHEFGFMIVADKDIKECI